MVNEYGDVAIEEMLAYIF